VGFLRSLQCDVIVVAAYGQILKRDLLSLPPLGCINVHASLLPQYRGPDPIRWTLLNGEEVTGVTIMLMDEGVDTGPILAQESLPILPKDTYASLTEKLGTLGGKLLREVLPAWKEGRITPRPQEGEPSYAPVVEKEKARICWESPAWYIVRQVRAFFPSPGAYTFFAGKRLKILEASWEGSDGTPCSPGTIHHVEREKGIVVCAGEGLVAIHRLQPEGGRAMSSWEFVCGYRLSVGQRMGGEVR
jgi:methionyl-tRNA formyltransferase